MSNLFANSIGIIFIFLLFLPLGIGLYGGSSADDEEPYWLTDGIGQYFPIDYLDLDQCMPKMGHSHVASYGLHFYIRRTYPCDSLLICYPGQLDGQNVNNGIVTHIGTRVDNVENNEVALKCEAKRREFCQKDGHGLCGSGGIGSIAWHGIVLSTMGHRLKMQLSITNSKYVFGRQNEHILIELANSRSLYATIRLSKKRRLISPLDNRKRAYFFKNVGKGARLQPYAGFWMLPVDMLPTNAEHKIHLFVYRSCQCAMHAWFRNPSTTLMPLKPPTTLGTEQCPAHRTNDARTKLSNLKTDDKILIRLLVDKNAKFIKLALRDINGETLLEVTIGQDNTIAFDASGIQGDWTLPTRIQMEPLAKRYYGKEIILEVHFHEFYFQIGMTDEVEGFPTTTLNRLWPRGWWNGLQFGRIGELGLDGDFVLINRPMIMDGESMAIILAPSFLQLELPMASGFSVVLRGRLNAEAKWMEICLLDAMQGDQNTTAAIALHIDISNKAIQFGSYWEMNWHNSSIISPIPFPFAEGHGFECIFEMKETKIEGNNKMVEFGISVNDVKLVGANGIGILHGQMPLNSSMTWVQLNGDVGLLQMPHLSN